MTKEKLAVENGVLRSEIDTLNEKEIKVRKEFAKAFDWTKDRGMYDKESQYMTTSWSQIFVEIGRLLSKENIVNEQKQFEQISSDMNNLWSEINGLKTKD